MVRAPNDGTYGTSSGAVYWKPSTSETYFYYIPEFETVFAPILGTLGLVLFYGRRVRSNGRKSRAPQGQPHKHGRGSASPTYHPADATWPADQRRACPPHSTSRLHPM